MKRGRDSLTGGTGDVNPQWLSFNAVESGADTTTTASQTLPVQRLPTSGRAQVMEVLKVLFNFTPFPATASATELVRYMQCAISTVSFSTTLTNLGEPRVFAGWKVQENAAFTAAGTYATIYPTTHVLDCTDGTGHGVLVATDNIYAQIASGNTSATNTCNIKILYRWKDVPLAEYIGIVQGQQ